MSPEARKLFRLLSDNDGDATLIPGLHGDVAIDGVFNLDDIAEQFAQHVKQERIVQFPKSVKNTTHILRRVVKTPPKPPSARARK